MELVRARRARWQYPPDKTLTTSTVVTPQHDQNQSNKTTQIICHKSSKQTMSSIFKDWIGPHQSSRHQAPECNPTMERTILENSTTAWTSPVPKNILAIIAKQRWIQLIQLQKNLYSIESQTHATFPIQQKATLLGQTLSPLYADTQTATELTWSLRSTCPDAIQDFSRRHWRNTNQPLRVETNDNNRDSQP